MRIILESSLLSVLHPCGVWLYTSVVDQVKKIVMLFLGDVLIMRRIWGYELLFAYLSLIRIGMRYSYGGELVY